MITFLIICVVIYFLFFRGNVHVNTYSIPRGFTYLDIDVRILSLASAVIKADGSVDPTEVKYVREYFISSFGQKRAQEAFAAFRSFNLKDDIDHVCTDLRYTVSYQSRGSILMFLFQVAMVDGNYSDAEHRLILSISDALGIDRRHFQYFYASFVNSGYKYSTATEKTQQRSPYEVLGVSEGASMDEVKQSYRVLAKKYHPDRLVKYPPEEQKIAKERFLEIQSAYEKIKSSW